MYWGPKEYYPTCPLSQQRPSGTIKSQLHQRRLYNRGVLRRKSLKPEYLNLEQGRHEPCREQVRNAISGLPLRRGSALCNQPEWDRSAPLREAIARLRSLPEVSAEALKLGLKEAPFEGGMSQICIRGDCSQKPKPEQALEMEEDVTLITVLNHIARAHAGSIWNYSEYRCDQNSLFSLGVLAE
jgi:hypothetical protein